MVVAALRPSRRSSAVPRFPSESVEAGAYSEASTLPLFTSSKRDICAYRLSLRFLDQHPNHEPQSLRFQPPGSLLVTTFCHKDRLCPVHKDPHYGCCSCHKDRLYSVHKDRHYVWSLCRKGGLCP